MGKVKIKKLKRKLEELYIKEGTSNSVLNLSNKLDILITKEQQKN